MLPCPALPRRALAALICAALAGGPALAGQVRLRAADDAQTRWRVELVDAQGRPVLAARTTDGAPVTVRYETTLAAGAEPVLLTLPEQGTLARPDAASTYYVATVTVRGVAQPWRFQVPSGAGPWEVPTLAEAAAIPPGSVLAQRLLPDPSAEAGGLCVQTLSGAYVLGACAEAGGATSLLGLLDGPGEYADGQCIVGMADGWGWGACGSGGGIAEETDPVYAISPAAGIDAGDIAGWDAAHSWGNHAGLYDLLGAATAALSAHTSAADPHPTYTTAAEASAAAPVQSVAGRTGAVTLAAADVSGVATAAQGALAETAVQPAGPGAAGLMPWTDLGDAGETVFDSLSLRLDGGAYAARIVGNADLFLTRPPADTLGWTVLYLTSDTGAWELSTPGAALWLDGAPAVIAPAIGETWEIACRVLGDGSVLISARVFY